MRNDRAVTNVLLCKQTTWKDRQQGQGYVGDKCVLWTECTRQKKNINV